MAIEPKTLGREFCKVTNSAKEFAVILASSNQVDRTVRILPARNAHEPISEAYFEAKCAMPSVINHAVETIRLGVILAEAFETLFIEKQHAMVVRLALFPKLSGPNKMHGCRVEPATASFCLIFSCFDFCFQ